MTQHRPPTESRGPNMEAEGVLTLEKQTTSQSVPACEEALHPGKPIRILSEILYKKTLLAEDVAVAPHADALLHAAGR